MNMMIRQVVAPMFEPNPRRHEWSLSMAAGADFDLRTLQARHQSQTG